VGLKNDNEASARKSRPKRLDARTNLDRMMSVIVNHRDFPFKYKLQSPFDAAEVFYCPSGKVCSAASQNRRLKRKTSVQHVVVPGQIQVLIIAAEFSKCGSIACDGFRGA
jgi:hypothetical protein